MPKTTKDMPDFEEESELPPVAPKPVAAKPPAKRPAVRARRGLGEELIEVYENSGDDFRSLNSFDHQARRWQRMLVWMLFFVVIVFIAVAGVSWYIWGRQPQFSGDQVVLEIQAPDKVTSGSAVTYVVHYANHENVSFSNDEIELRYPQGFQFVSADPQPSTSQNLFELSSIAAQHDGTITVQGLLIGKTDVPSTISGVWRYWPSNFSSEFQEVASAQTQVDPVNIQARIEGPDQVLSGQKTSYSVIYSNPGQDSLKDLRLEMTYPAGFVVSDSKPDLTEQNRYLAIDELKPGQEQELQINGFYSAASDDPVDFNVEVSQKTASDDYFPQKELKQTTKIIRGDLVVNTVANGTNTDSSVQWGDTVHGSITYQNNSEATLADLQVVATLETRYVTKSSGKGNGGAFDWTSLVDSRHGSMKDLPPTDEKSLGVRSITWTKNEEPSLASLDPKKDGTIDFQVDLLDLAAARKRIQYPEDVQLVLSVVVTVGKTGTSTDQLTVSSNPIHFAVNSDLALTAEARYYDQNGNQVGSGPLPPQVGQKTKYRVYWTLSNTVHDVANVLVSTSLPDNVAWDNAFQVSAGEVVYTASNSTLTWKLNLLPHDVKTATLSFDVDLNPGKNQIGGTAPLTNKTTMTATDSQTSGSIIQTLSALTTAAEHDNQASDKAIVLPQ